MLSSMTGYGRQEAILDSGVLSMEMRSVNHRYLELGIRLPDELRTVEAVFRERVAMRLKRGKVDLTLKFQSRIAAAGALVIDSELAKQVVNAAAEVESMCSSSRGIDPIEVLRWPGVVCAPDVDHELLQQAALKLLDSTLDDFLDARSREGQKTQQMLNERLDQIETIVAQTRAVRPQVLARLGEKIKNRINDLDVSVDQGRLEQEIVYAAQRLDVNEELDRLDAHISEVRDIFNRKEPVGRRLDFLIQEFNREANTLGSKSADAGTTVYSVELKVLIEQMREQVQNIE